LVDFCLCVLSTVLAEMVAACVHAVQGLKAMVVGEEQVLFQASNALSQCVKTVSHSRAAFVGSAEAVECHRLLLVACMTTLCFVIASYFSIITTVCMPCSKKAHLLFFE